MTSKEFIKELRKLEAETGPKTSSALIEIIEIKMSDFKTYVDQRFTAIDERFTAMDHRFTTMDHRFTTLQWMMGIGFTVLSGLMIAIFTTLITRF